MAAKVQKRGVWALGSALVLLHLFEAASPLALPSYVKPCKPDATLDACALKNANVAWKTVVKGDRKYRIPVLDPLVVEKLVINSDASRTMQLNLTLLDSKIVGLASAKVTHSKMDLKAREFEWSFTVPRLSILGNYQVSGKILVLPITGSGPANFTITDMLGKISLDYTTEKRKGEEYIKVGKAAIQYQTSRLYARMDNLFNGDKTLSDNMNQVIDDNWEEFNKELGPRVAEALAVVMKAIVTNIVGLVPYKNIFPA